MFAAFRIVLRCAFRRTPKVSSVRGLERRRKKWLVIPKRGDKLTGICFWCYILVRPFADSNVAPPTSVDSRKGQLLSSSSPPTNTTADPPRSSHTLASPRHLFPLRPRDLLPAGRRVNLPSQTEAGAAMTLAEFEAATFQHLREVAAKKKTLQQTATPHRQPPAEVIVLDGDG